MSSLICLFWSLFELNKRTKNSQHGTINCWILLIRSSIYSYMYIFKQHGQSLIYYWAFSFKVQKVIKKKVFYVCGFQYLNNNNIFDMYFYNTQIRIFIILKIEQQFLDTTTKHILPLCVLVCVSYFFQISIWMWMATISSSSLSRQMLVFVAKLICKSRMLSLNFTFLIINILR